MKITLSGTPLLQSAVASIKTVPQAVDRAAYRAVNKVAAKTVTRSRKLISSQLSLKSDYIRDRMRIDKASPGNPTAIIRARLRATTLSSYGASQLTRGAKNRKARGDALRAIAAGRKAAGISVEVKRGVRKKMPGAFTLPLRAGKVSGGNGFGVFIRRGGRLEHQYGPSVDQAFRRIKDELAPEISADLATTFFAQLAYELKSK